MEDGPFLFEMARFSGTVTFTVSYLGKRKVMIQKCRLVGYVSSLKGIRNDTPLPHSRFVSAATLHKSKLSMQDPPASLEMASRAEDFGLALGHLKTTGLRVVNGIITPVCK